MFQWLVKEMMQINTKKFHLIDGPAAPELQMAVENSGMSLPPSYKEFVLQFGNAKLYRRRNYYLIEIYAGPREAVSDSGEALVNIGRTHTSLVYFKESLLVQGGESPVYEWQDGKCLQQTAEGFEQWLKTKCEAARRQYNKQEWDAIEQGPGLFSEYEKAVVKARRNFRCRVVGIAPNGNLQIEIYNGSDMILPYYSVGIIGKLRPPKSGPLQGGVYLPVSSVLPGETKIIEHDCYKQFCLPEDTKVLDRPDPGPEDRELYWEFKPLVQ